MRKFLILTITVSLLTLTGCKLSIHGQAISPNESLIEWQKGAVASWKSDISKNVIESRGKYAYKWSACKEGFKLTDYEIGFCQGFHLNHAIFRENIFRIQGDLASNGGNYDDYKLFEIPKTEKWAKTICNEDGYGHVTQQQMEPSLMRVLPNELILGEPTKIEEWFAGCVSGVKFQQQLMELFEKSKLGESKINEYKSSVLKAKIFTETRVQETKDEPYNSNFKKLLINGKSSGNELYDECAKDAKILIENGTDPNSNFYAQLGNSLMINIEAGPKKKLCGTAYVDVKDVYNFLIETNILAAAAFINEH